MSGQGVRRTVLVLSLGLGVVGDQLLRAPGAPGLNLTVCALLGVGCVLWVRAGRGGLSADVVVLLAAAVLFSVAITWRDAALLRVLNMLVAGGCALLAAGAPSGAWLRRARVLDYPLAGLIGGLSAAGGAGLLVRAASVGVPTGPGRRHALAAVRGTLVAVPLLLVFGGLLAAADPVFDHLLLSTVSFELEQLVAHAVTIGVLSWGSAGYLGRFIGAPSAALPELPLPRVRLGIVEGTVALGLLNALFLSFVLVQLRYLFGGADLVAVTPGLTFAEYARTGFFQLVAVGALVVPLLLLADWLVRRERGVEHWIFRGFALGQVLLLYAILGSAFYRLQLYQQMYGLTEARLYASVFMGWIALVLGWLAVTVLRGRRHLFAFGALAAGLVAAICVNLVNPQAIIVRVNAERAVGGARYDVAYAGGLSGDAIPALVSSLDTLPADDRCEVATMVLERWLPARPGGWRTFSYSDWRARRTVTASAARLLELSRSHPCTATETAGMPPASLPGGTLEEAD